MRTSPPAANEFQRYPKIPIDATDEILFFRKKNLARDKSTRQ